jgi:hypothetical protein
VGGRDCHYGLTEDVPNNVHAAHAERLESLTLVVAPAARIPAPVGPCDTTGGIDRNPAAEADARRVVDENGAARFGVFLLVLFGGWLSVAAAGIYGVIACAVTQRRARSAFGCARR